MITSWNRAVKSATIVFLAMLAFVTMGVVPAHALVDTDFGVTATAKAGEAGQGTLTIVPAANFPGPVTVNVYVVGTGGTLAGGGIEQLVVLTAGVPVSVAYNCAGSSMELGVRFPGKGGPGFGVIAPCGAVVVLPPAPSWNQSATIVPGPDGSGNADVLFNNEQSNRAGSFHITINGGAPMSTTSVVAGQTKSIPVHAEPGSVIRVYGTNDGTATPRELKKFTLLEAPAVPVPSWNQSATIVPGPNGSGDATVVFDNEGSNQVGGFYVTIGDGVPTSAIPVAAGEKSEPISVHAEPGSVIRVYGTKDGTATPLLLKELTLPKAPIAPAPSWNQSATIVPGPDGSGNADVLFNNEQSNRAGSFHITINGGAPMSTTSVVAGQTKSIPVHAEPGSVIRVYGTNDGTATPRELKKFTLLEAPAVPAPSSGTPPANQPASVTNNLPHASNKAGATSRQRGEWGNPTFKTGASVPSQAVLAQPQGVPLGAVLAFTVAGLTAIYLIGSVVALRRRA